MLRIGILRGGGGSDHDASVASGAYPLFLISEKFKDKYRVYDIFIDKEGVWHFRGMPINPSDLSSKIDIFINTLTNEYTGAMHNMNAFEGIGVPYVGARPLEYALTNNRELSKERFKTLGIKTPEGFRIDYKGEYGEEHAKNIAKEIWERVGPPWIVRPVNQGSNTGIHVCKTFGELAEAIQENFFKQNDIFVEEMVDGRRVSTVVVDGYRNSSPYIFPFLEATRDKSEIAKLGDHIKDELHKLTREIHEHFNIGHMASLHFIVHPRKGVYVDVVDTSPSLAEDSHLMRSVTEVGGTHEEFVEHLIEMVRK